MNYNYIIIFHLGWNMMEPKAATPRESSWSRRRGASHFRPLLSAEMGWTLGHRPYRRVIPGVGRCWDAVHSWIIWWFVRGKYLQDVMGKCKQKTARVPRWRWWWWWSSSSSSSSSSSGVRGGSDKSETFRSWISTRPDAGHQSRGALARCQHPRNADLRKWLASSV